MKNSALITGVTGQDGSYLTELLLEKDYKVFGLVRRGSTNTTKERLDTKILNHPDFVLVEGDLVDPSSINNIVRDIRPDECYNLAAQSHVGTSFSQPHYTFQVDAVGVLNILESIRAFSPETKFYQASTSEMFGSNCSQIECEAGDNGAQVLQLFGDTVTYYKNIQDEGTPFSPNSPYAVAKVAAHNLVRIYRDSYNIHASAGILHNHESPRRGENFVTRKITKYVAEVYNSVFMYGVPLEKLALGNLDSYRDWGHAKDYVRGMWMILQQDKPDDYVLATGETHSVREFVVAAFDVFGIKNWADYVHIDPRLFRPCEVPYLCGDATKAKRVLGWSPTVNFNELVKLMVEGDFYGKK